MLARTSGRGAVKGPDFICVGAPRSGTSWLYEVLSRHPGLWLPPIKELHYFDQPSGKERYYSHLRMRLISALWIKHPLSRFDLTYFLGHRDDAWYCKLFEPARRRGLLTGEITPAYSILDEQSFRRLRALNPEVKLIFIMRDPVMRAWSAVMKMQRKNGSSAVPDVAEAIRYARGPAVWKRTSYVENIERLECVFSPEQIHYGFFDHLMREPESFVREVLAFLGVEAGDVAGLLPPGPVNAAAGGRNPPPEFSRALVGDFMQWVDKLCARFDGPPHEWRMRYRAFLQSDPPQRSDRL